MNDHRDTDDLDSMELADMLDELRRHAQAGDSEALADYQTVMAAIRRGGAPPGSTTVDDDYTAYTAAWADVADFPPAIARQLLDLVDRAHRHALEMTVACAEFQELLFLIEAEYQPRCPDGFASDNYNDETANVAGYSLIFRLFGHAAEASCGILGGRSTPLTDDELAAIPARVEALRAGPLGDAAGVTS